MEKSSLSEEQITIALRDKVFVERLWRSVNTNGRTSRPMTA